MCTDAARYCGEGHLLKGRPKLALSGGASVYFNGPQLRVVRTVSLASTASAQGPIEWDPAKAFCSCAWRADVIRCTNTGACASMSGLHGAGQ